MSEIKLSINNSRKAYHLIYLMIFILIAGMIFFRIKNIEINKSAQIGVMIFSLGGIIITELHRLRDTYQITTNFVIHLHGFYRKEIKRISLESISDVDLNVNFIQRTLSYGNVYIYRYGEKFVMEIKNINKPQMFIDCLEKMTSEKVKRGLGNG